MRICHHCGQDIGALERIGRRDACLHCGADLHCCLNCTFYDAHYHNQCREPQAERQVDKDVGNFCEFFSFRRPAAGVSRVTDPSAGPLPVGSLRTARSDTLADSAGKAVKGAEDARARLAALFKKKQ